MQRIKKILQVGHPVLRKQATEIKQSDIQQDKIQTLADLMVAVLYENQGVGLAAPQIGESRQVIIIENSPGKSRRKKADDFFPQHILINPKLVKASGGLVLDWEACLSIDNGDLLGLVPRNASVIVEALDRAGKKTVLKARGFMARVLQHEIDHLNGILFTERMRKKDMTSLTTRHYWEKYYNNSKKIYANSVTILKT